MGKNDDFETKFYGYGDANDNSLIRRFWATRRVVQLERDENWERTCNISLDLAKKRTEQGLSSFMSKGSKLLQDS